MSIDIETAFHTSLDRLMRGEATLDSCVADYPEHGQELRELLVIALDMQALAPLPLERQAVERGARLIDEELQHLRARLERQPEPASAWERLTWWLPRFMPVRMAGIAAAFAIALIAYGGVTLAAVNSGPDSALYGYRLTLEELRIGFATDEQKAYLYLDTAEQRLREIESAAGLGDAVAVARASTAYQEVVRKGVDVLDAVARDARPGANRTGEVAEDYRRRLAEHDTRFNSLTHSTARAQHAPISRAQSRAQAGLQDVHRGPILAIAPTATPDPGLTPSVTGPPPESSPSPTPVAQPAQAVPPTPAPPTPTATPAPTPQATPEPTATATPVPAIDISGSTVIVTGELQAVTVEAVVVAGISIRRGDEATVDAVPLAARTRAEATVAGDGTLTLVAISVVESTPVTAEAGPDGQPTASPDPSPTPESPPEATATPEASPTPEPPVSERTPASDASPTPTATEGEPTATPESVPTQTTTPGDGQPTPDASSTPAATPEATATPEPSPTEGAPSPTPTVTADAPSPTPETTPSPEATDSESTPTPPAETQPTPDPSATPTPDPTPAESPISPTPAEGEPTPAPETPTPEPTPPEAERTTTEPPADATPTATPASTATPIPAAETPAAPLPPTLQGVLVAIDSFSVRAGGIVFTRPLDSPLVLHGPMAPGDSVLVTFEALRAASSYVLVAREVAPSHPADGTVSTRWQGFVGEVSAETLTLNGVRVQVPPEAREDDVWASLAAGALVEIDLAGAATADPVAAALRLLRSGAAQSFSNLTLAPFG